MQTEQTHKLSCGHVVSGVPGKIPHHRATGLFCDDCKAWVALSEWTAINIKAITFRISGRLLTDFAEYQAAIRAIGPVPSDAMLAGALFELGLAAALKRIRKPNK